MTWTAQVIDRRPMPSNGLEWVVFHACVDDPTQSFQQCYQLTSEGTIDDVSRLVRARLASVNKPVNVPPIDLAEPVVAPVPVPIIDPAVVTFRAKVATLRKSVAISELGLKPTSDIATLQASVQSDLDAHPEYEDVV